MGQKTIKIGYHDAIVNGKKCKIYPDSGASGTIVPRSLVKGTNKGCNNSWSVLSGNVRKFTRHRVPITFNGKTKTIIVSQSGLKPGLVWMGYPHLKQFGIERIDITKAAGDYKLIKPLKKIKC